MNRIPSAPAALAALLLLTLSAAAQPREVYIGTAARTLHNGETSYPDSRMGPFTMGAPGSGHDIATVVVHPNLHKTHVLFDVTLNVLPDHDGMDGSGFDILIDKCSYDDRGFYHCRPWVQQFVRVPQDPRHFCHAVPIPQLDTGDYHVCVAWSNLSGYILHSFVHISLQHPSPRR